MPTINSVFTWKGWRRRPLIVMELARGCFAPPSDLGHHRCRQPVLLSFPHIVNGRTDMFIWNPEITPSEFPVSNCMKWGWILIFDDWKLV